jgi:antitoxin (DNA-binding transcriptional repressor) of toxin-antitoxin stability system
VRLVGLAQQGEEIVIASQGRIVARLTGVPPVKPPPGRHAWLAKLARLRESTATGKSAPTTEEILDDLSLQGFSGVPARPRAGPVRWPFPCGPGAAILRPELFFGVESLMLCLF